MGHRRRGDRHPAAQRVRGRRRRVDDHIRAFYDHVRGAWLDDPREGRRRGTRRGRHSGLGAQTLNIAAEEENSKATGEFQITENVFKIDCADTHTDNVVILGGEATGGPDVSVGDLLALIIREGDPDSVALYANDSGAASCTELLKSIPDDLATNDSNFVDVEDGYDIETA